MRALGIISGRSGLLAALLFTVAAALAQQPSGDANAPPPAGPGGTGGGQGMHDHPHGPPPAAFDACKGKASGDPCTFTMPRGEMNGACWGPPDTTKALFCRVRRHAPTVPGTNGDAAPGSGTRMQPMQPKPATP